MATSAPNAYLLPYLKIATSVRATNLMTFKGVFALVIKYLEYGM